jgi:hypothetical protein
MFFEEAENRRAGKVIELDAQAGTAQSFTIFMPRSP